MRDSNDSSLIISFSPRSLCGSGCRSWIRRGDRRSFQWRRGDGLAVLVQPPVHVVGTLWEWSLSQKPNHIFTGDDFACKEQLSDFLDVFAVSSEEVCRPLVCAPMHQINIRSQKDGSKLTLSSGGLAGPRVHQSSH